MKDDIERGLEHVERVNDLLSFFVMKKLIMPIYKTDAYKLGIIDRMGKMIKNPETKEEKLAYGSFDKLMFKLKRLLGNKIGQLNNFMYVQSTVSDFYDNLIVLGSVEKRAIVKRIKQDMEKLFEKYDMDRDAYLKYLVMEELKEQE